MQETRTFNGLTGCFFVFLDENGCRQEKSSAKYAYKAVHVESILHTDEIHN
jgi:hypothetical protein